MPVLVSKIHPLWKIPRLVGSVVLAMVIMVNYAIGGFFFVRAFNTHNNNNNNNKNNNNNNNHDQPIKK